MVAQIEESHPSNTTKMPYPSNTEVPITIEVTPHTTTKVPATGDMEVAPLVEIEVTTLASTESSVYC